MSSKSLFLLWEKISAESQNTARIFQDLLTNGQGSSQALPDFHQKLNWNNQENSSFPKTPKINHGLEKVCLWSAFGDGHTKQKISLKAIYSSHRPARHRQKKCGREMGWERECVATPTSEAILWLKDPSRPPGTISTRHRKIKFINVNVLFLKVGSVFAVTWVEGMQIHFSIRSPWDSSDIKERRGWTLPQVNLLLG